MNRRQPQDCSKRLQAKWRQPGWTLISETVVDSNVQTYSIFGVEEAVADGVVLMGNIIRQGDLLRSLQVVKMRGTKHSRARHLIELTPIGLAVVPLLKWGQDGGQAFT